tara:strand:+ start:296 stop:697 length:402 start_codon:yes stop_codon:yes gene_type:complete
MGYRSQVVLAISKRLRPAFMAALAPNKEATALVFNHHDTLDLDYGGDGSLLVVWDGIKWYSGTGDNVIDLIDKFVDDAGCDTWEFENDPEDLHGPESASSEHFRFVKVGEESDDIECRGEGFWDIYPHTSISY